MFDTVRNNHKIVQFVLALIILPFAFWGVDSYIRDSDGGAEVAKVGDSKISAGEFQRALQEQQDRLRASLGGRDPALLESPELRLAVLDNLVQRRLLGLHASKSNMAVSDGQLIRAIASVPQLQENGQFSPQRYEALIAAQNMSKAQFEFNVRQDMSIQQAITAVANASLAGNTAGDRWLALQLEEREISESVLRAESFVGKAKVAAEAIKTFYEANTPKFELPEQVRVEYLVFSLDSLLQGVQVSPEEVRAAYETVGKARDEARERAVALLAEVRKAPQRFTDLAREKSQDPGSKENGGDLGFFGRGMMVKPFEDAVFKMKVDEISDVVESDFGFHIITLKAIRKGAAGEERQASHILLTKPAGTKSFEAARSEIEAKLKRDRAAKQYAEIAESFSNTVYEQPDSLAPAAEKFKLPLQQSDWLAKGGPARGLLENPKLLTAVFADDAIKNKRNTEAVEVAPNVLVAARVLEHKPALQQTLETVAPTIEKFLAGQEAVKLAAQEGEQRLGQLNRGEKSGLAWSNVRKLTRAAAVDLPPEAVRAIFKADASKLPAFVGAATPTGYTLFRVTQVKPFVAAGTKPEEQTVRGQYARTLAEQELSAWLSILKDKYLVSINQSAIEIKER